MNQSTYEVQYVPLHSNFRQTLIEHITNFTNKITEGQDKI